MKKSIEPKPILSPQLVEMLATYNEDGSVNLMNAAWGGQLDTDLLVLSLDKSHRTVENILREKCFTLGLPKTKDIVDCDFAGIVSGNKDKDKFEKTDLHAYPSKVIHAPLIEEFPISFECEVFKIFDDEEVGFYVVAKVKNIVIDEEVIRERGRFDTEMLDLAFFCPLDNTYRKFGPKVADAFSCGLAKKK